MSIDRARHLAAASLLLVASLSAREAHAEKPLAPPPSWTVPSLHALGLMTVMRASEAYLWPDPFAETNRYALGLHYQQAFTQPPRWDTSKPWLEADGDHWPINVVGHGLFGSELYLRARTCGRSPGPALAFTALASATWEYGFEANGVQPSGLDLLLTPAAGLVLGEARFFAWSSASRLARGPWRSVLMVVFDPLGELERAAGTPC